MSRQELVQRTISVLGETLTITGYETDGYFQHITQDPMADVDILIVASLILSPDSTVLDVGANIGYETVFLGTLLTKGRVHAFEPVPSNVRIVKQNITTNHLRNVTIHNVGLGDKQLTTEIKYNEGNRGGAFVTVDEANAGGGYDRSERVHIEVLDDLIKQKKIALPKCDLVKVDIEGFEPAFLRGATAFLKKYQPAMIIEANHWCLDGLNRTSMPDFIDQLLQIYPYAAAFDNNQWIDIKKNRVHFMHENMVFRRFQNIYGDFNRARWKKVIGTSQTDWEKVTSLSTKVAEVERENQELHETIAMLQAQIKRPSVASRLAGRAKRIIH